MQGRFSPSNDSLAAVRGRRWFVSLLLFVLHPSRCPCFVTGRSVCVFASVTAMECQCGALRWAAGSLPPHRPGGNVTPLVLGTPTMGAAAGTVGGGGADPGCGDAWRGRPPPPTQSRSIDVLTSPRRHHAAPPGSCRPQRPRWRRRGDSCRLGSTRQAGRHGPGRPRRRRRYRWRWCRAGPGRRLAGPLCRAWPAWLFFYGATAGCSFPRPDFLFPKVVNHGGMR